MSDVSNNLSRRRFLRTTAAGTAATALLSNAPGLTVSGSESEQQGKAHRRPNIVFLLPDQWRAQATGYAGDENAETPNLDQLAASSVNFTSAVSNCPVCCPYRGSLLTGQYPLRHGVFMNDVSLPDDAVSMAEVFKDAGYNTGYIGKWHLDGRGRSSFIPPERRQGFDYWRANECTHNYMKSLYYGDTPEKKYWPGYDAIAQTEDARRYIMSHKDDEQPFLLVLSWGSPHAPYHLMPEQLMGDPDPEDIVLRDNVPDDWKQQTKNNLSGYYAHIKALDQCVGRVVETLQEAGLSEDTILVFTSDHGDMLGSHGQMKKQQPYDESLLVPFLLRYPRLLGEQGLERSRPIGTPDIMPTLLGLSGLAIPETVEGTDRTALILGEDPDCDEAALIMCPSPFGQWPRARGGREYRGVRTKRYTYVRSLDGPWLLFDNETDPFQQTNLIDLPEHAELQARLEAMLQQKLEETDDEFLSGPEYLGKWGYKVNASGTVPYTN